MVDAFSVPSIHDLFLYSKKRQELSTETTQMKDVDEIGLRQAKQFKPHHSGVDKYIARTTLFYMCKWSWGT